MIAEWPGYCPTCEAATSHVQYGEWLRDELVCRLCASNPRLRAISYVLSIVRAGWRQQRLWELAPAGPMSAKLQADCDSYVASHYWTDVPPGENRDGVRCEDVEHPTFGDEAFDIVIASDVFEHVFDIELALTQVARVLAPDGVFIWTVPLRPGLDISRRRAVREAGSIEYLLPAEYHSDPVDDEGVLVTFDWGHDLPALVEDVCGMTTSVFRIESRTLGILGEHIEVFVSCPSVDGWAAGARREERAQAREVELTGQVDELRVTVTELTAAMEELRAQSALTLRAATDHLAESQRVAAMHRDENLALRTSTSWQVTRPLRAISGVLKRSGP